MNKDEASQAARLICDQIDRVCVTGGSPEAIFFRKIRWHCERRQRELRGVNMPDNCDQAVDLALRVVQSHFGVQIDSMLGPSRNRRICGARYTVYLILHEDLKMSYQEIGIVFNRDHGSVMVGLDRILDLCDTELVLLEMVRDCRKMFGIQMKQRGGDLSE